MTEYNGLIDRLMEEKDELTIYLKALQKSLASSPEGTLEIERKSKNCIQYYHHDSNHKRNHGRRYLPKKEEPFIQQLAQKSYDQKVIKIIEKRLYHIDMLLKQYRPSIHLPYMNLSEVRQSLVTPIIPTDEEYTKQWFEDNPGSQNPFEFNNTFMGYYGEPVRSKSEALLTNIFAKLGIPYVYEPMISLSTGAVCYPDFLLLSITHRKSFIYEHFGMMDDPEYAIKCVKKINLYDRNGYVLGETFLCSFESRDIPYDEVAIEAMLRAHLL